MATDLIPYSDMERMAAVIAQSGLFGIKTPTQALALMLIAQAEGLHPATAARDYHVINGRPALKADAMLAKFQAAGGKVQWHEYTDVSVAATFSHPQGGAVKIGWTIDQAGRAGLTGRDVWKQYPRAMLRARVISEGIRTVYPGVLAGMYTPEEVRDMAEVPVPHDPGCPALPALPSPLPTTVAYDVDKAERTIASFDDVTKMRVWLATERKRMGWRPGDPLYEALKAVATERAETIGKEKAAKEGRPPLSPAPGKAETMESLKATSDDQLEQI